MSRWTGEGEKEGEELSREEEEEEGTEHDGDAENKTEQIGGSHRYWKGPLNRV